MLKKIISIILCAIMLMAQMPMAVVGLSYAETAHYDRITLNDSEMIKSEINYVKDEALEISSASDKASVLDADTDYVEILKVCDNEEEFVLGCDFETIIYGIPEMEYEGKFYQFIDGKLYVSQGDHEKKRVIVEQDGDNINIFDGVMYYTVFEDGKAYIRALDIETESISNVLETGTEKICYMYVINNELLMYLADGIVYQCLLGSEDIQRVSPRDDIYNFIPTFDGNVYATGNRWNNTLYFNEMHLADGVSYYSIIKEHLVVSFTAEFFQCPMKTLVIAYSEEGTQEFDLESNMVLYNLDGEDEYEYTGEEYGEERDCACCEEGWPESPEEIGADNIKISYLSQNSIPSWMRIIIRRTRDVTEATWNCLEPVLRWTSDAQAPSAGDEYTYNGNQMGLPYSRKGRYTSDPNYVHQYIGYANSGSTVVYSIDDFLNRVADESDPFYLSAQEGEHDYFGPLYGMDCSSFASYAWNLNTRYTTAGFSSCAACELVPNITMGSFTTGDFSKLQPGDVMVCREEDNLIGSNHAIIIVDIVYDSGGAVSKMIIADARVPLATQRERTATQFINMVNTYKYKFYRLKPANRPSYNSTVIFNACGGTSTRTTIAVITGETYDHLRLTEELRYFPTATREGYTFLGWYTSSTGGSKVTSSTIVTATSNHSLYAHWSANEYTVTFNANGGVVVPKNKTVTYGSAYGSLPIPTRTGYYFTGWKTALSGGVLVDSSTIVSIAQNHTLYANWIIETPVEGTEPLID